MYHIRTTSHTHIRTLFIAAEGSEMVSLPSDQSSCEQASVSLPSSISSSPRSPIELPSDIGSDTDAKKEVAKDWQDRLSSHHKTAKLLKNPIWKSAVGNFLKRLECKGREETNRIVYEEIRRMVPAKAVGGEGGTLELWGL